MKSKRNIWTAEQIEKLKQIYPDMRAADVAAELGVSVGAVYNMAYLHGCKKSEAFMQSVMSGRTRGQIGIAGRFKKGHVPHNKGKRMICTEGMKRNWFKPGHLPHNTKHDLAETVRIHKSDNKPSVWVRVGVSKWKQKSHLLWEETFGSIPDGMVVAFKDGDPMHVELNNLELISRSELMRRNSIQRYPKELKQAMKANSKLKKIIKQYGKKQAE